MVQNVFNILNLIRRYSHARILNRHYRVHNVFGQDVLNVAFVEFEQRRLEHRLVEDGRRVGDQDRFSDLEGFRLNHHVVSQSTFTVRVRDLFIAVSQFGQTTILTTRDHP